MEGLAMMTERTREIMKRYWDSDHSDAGMLADDVVFTIMATGEQHRGPAAIRQLLDYFYRVAFDAHAETRNLIIDGGKAIYEGTFIGTHIGEFAGVPATKKQVRVPLCISYDLDNDRIQNGRVYFEMPVLMKQLTG